jgi:hypothetical protein
MPLSNKNRRENAKQVKRDERGAYICVFLVAVICPNWAPSRLSSFFVLLPSSVQIITLNDRQEKVIESLIC